MKNSMKCSCCNHKKGLFESFEIVMTDDIEINLCSKCAVPLYHIRDAYKGNDIKSAEKYIKAVNKRINKKADGAFISWYGEQLKKWKPQES